MPGAGSPCPSVTRVPPALRLVPVEHALQLERELERRTGLVEHPLHLLRAHISMLGEIRHAAPPVHKSDHVTTALKVTTSVRWCGVPTCRSGARLSMTELLVCVISCGGLVALGAFLRMVVLGP